MAAKDKSLLITLKAALGSSFSRVFKKGKSAIEGIGSAYKKMNREVERASASVTKLQKRENEYLSALQRGQDLISERGLYRYRIMEAIALGGALAAPIRKMMELESLFGKIKMMAKFPKNMLIEEVAKPFYGLSRKVPMSAKSLGEIGYIAAAAKIKKTEIPKFTEEVSKSLVAWRETENTEIVDSLVRVMKEQKISTSELPKFFDMVTHLGSEVGRSPGDIIKTMDAARKGLAFFKLSNEQAAALSGTMLKLGNSSEKAGAAIDNMFRTLLTAETLSNDAKKVLYSLGVTTSALPEMIKANPQRVLGQILGGLANIKDEDGQKRAISTLFGKKSGETIGHFIKNLDDYKTNLAILKNDNYKGERDEDFKTVSEELSSQMRIFKNNLDILSKDIGEGLSPAIKKLTELVNKLLKPLTEFMEEHKTLTSFVTTIIGGVLGFRIVKNSLGFIKSLFKGAGQSAVTTYKKGKVIATKSGIWGSVFKKKAGKAVGKTLLKRGATSLLGGLAGGPVGWALTLLSVGSLIWEYWEPIKEFFSSIWDKAGPHWDSFCNKLKGWAGDIISAWSKVKEFFGSAWDGIVSGSKKAYEKITSPNSILGRATRAISDWFESIKSPAARKLKAPQVNPIGSNVRSNQNIDKSVTFNIYGANNPRETADIVWDYMRRRDQQELYDNPMVTV